jgi:hypothetical protein
MNTANTTPNPATVTKPPLCAKRPGAALVELLTVPAEVVLLAELFDPFSVADAVAEALLAPAFVVDAVELPALPVADALVPVPAAVPEATIPAVDVLPPAFVVL